MTERLILVVEDERPIRELISLALTRGGFGVVEAGDVPEAQQAIAAQPPDLVLLDWMLPNISGIEFARTLRRDDLTRDLPIIMLTARGEEEDRIGGLDAGCDDYIAKPFSPRELVARIRAVFRRVHPGSERPLIEMDGLTLDPAGHRVLAQGQPVNMGPTEFRLLEFFMTHPERVYSRTQLLDRVWGRNAYVEERTVDVHILRLRKCLSHYGLDGMIQTVRGSGYRFSSRV